MSEGSKRRKFRVSPLTLFVAVTLVGWLAAFLYGVYGKDGSIFDDPEAYWSGFSGRPAITMILVFAVVAMGGGALLTWLVMRPKG